MTEVRDAGTPTEPDGSAPPNEERVLMRSEEGRLLTGVCAGLGRYTGMDPVLFRVGFAALVVGSGIGIMLYIAAFLLMRHPSGGPGFVEQWTRRVFDTDTVMALLAAIFAVGLIINLAADGISTASVVVATLLAVALLAAHARGVDLLTLTRSLPERIRGRRGTHPAPEHWLGRPFGGERPFAQPGPAPFPGAPSASAPYPGAAFSGAAGSGAPAPGAPFSGAPASGAPAFGSPAFGASGPTSAAAPPPPAPATSALHDTSAPQDTAAPPAAASATASDAHTVPGRTPQDAPPATAAFASPGPDQATIADAPPAAGTGAESPTYTASHPAGHGSGPGTTAAGAGWAGAAAPEPEYRRLADLAGAAARRPAGAYDSSGEPFAPRGPYRPHYDSQRQYEPPAWVYGGAAARTGRPRREREKSYIGGITMFAALMVGGIMVATQSPTSQFNVSVVGGAILITIGAGLLIATWFGRGAGLVATGTILSLLLVAGSTVSGIPRKIGSYTWAPVETSQIMPSYAVGIGDGTLDLRHTKLPPGSRTRFDASVSVGELKVFVPPTARVEVFGYTRLGDVKIEHTVQSGADVRHVKTLEPDVTPKGGVPIIELHVEAGVGDVEVSREAA
ncbi:hypothetical protein Sme01_42990 [Sphaerisporangium melleum]|uniref:Phage shock protein PspC N-terminal domain-containing protein n=1 Tax=Sphaerisporangium melleum TaxID=321316 RepID=A0A917QYF5_9ACTN|nr:PspC domain-containing protein [Sphaerisporangium melleum]GGK77223.1 hypothetical protein GCM10007964_19950 [Sphaerisporangium melleum]GII71823.1 hypothetical protein Sme01_42990 [Sphaerisporangium melleum]